MVLNIILTALMLLVFFGFYKTWILFKEKQQEEENINIKAIALLEEIINLEKKLNIKLRDEKIKEYSDALLSLSEKDKEVKKIQAFHIIFSLLCFVLGFLFLFVA